jgi:hypothetical protein
LATIVDTHRAILELKVDFRRGADANQAGVILTRLASAYSKHCRGIGVPNARLVVDRVEIASLFAVLEGVVDLVKGAKTVIDNRELIASFAHELAAAIMTIENANPGGVPSFMRSLIRALIAPMSKGAATRTSIKVVSVDGASIELDSADAETIERVLKLGHDVLLSDERLTLRAQKHRPALDYAAPTVPTYMVGLPAPNRGLKGAQLHGTLVHTLGTWYVRPVRLDGVMLPATLGHTVQQVDPSATYLASGYLVPPDGLPTRFQVEAIDRRLS